jgi:hypothetical protein
MFGAVPSYIGTPDPRESETSFLAAPPARPDLARPRPSRLPAPPPPPDDDAELSFDEATDSSQREAEPSPLEALFAKGLARLNEASSDALAPARLAFETRAAPHPSDHDAYVEEPAPMPAPRARHAAPLPSYPPSYVHAGPNDSWVEAPWLVPSAPRGGRTSMLPIAATAAALLALLVVGALLFAVRATDAGARKTAEASPPAFAAQPVLAPQPIPQPVATMQAPLPQLAPALVPPSSALGAQAATPIAAAPAPVASTKPAPRTPVVRAPKPAPEPKEVAEPKKPKSNGKSVEEILSELGEEQLKR